ncbi:MAG: S8 family peptidase [Luteococcus sp.]|uniref:S8 family peptidase n=1 Tax=Luteococcus sp. TaxID=1969402 RepID=UPI002649B8E6|nr:S8 family peptidase [Luteococcus sp.]MDN5564671.1 S8 family peptidase [Luteococcus sp.]
MFLTTSFRRVLSVLVTLGTLLAAGLATAPAEAAPQPKTRWIVRFATQDAMRTVQASSDATAPGRARHVFRQAFPGVATSMTASQAALLRKLPGVLSVRPDRRIRAFDVQNNPPRGLDRVDQRTSQATRTYTSTKTGEGVTAYIVDSGINRAHTDFTGRLSSGPNYDLPGTPPDDCAGHGTHVAGILAGTRHGVAKKARIVPIRVLDCDSGGFESDTLAALDWVVANHAAGKPAVLNMSLGGDASTEMTAAVKRVLADGVTVVGAAGNAPPDGKPTSACNVSPANLPAVITVANSSVWNRQSPTSNYGSCVDLYAPGEDITSAWIGSSTAVAQNSGTSMAAPFVSGLAALVAQARPTWTPAQVAAQVTAQATPNVIANPTSGTPNRMINTLSTVTPGMIEKAPRPTISGTTQVGQTLTSSAGTWGVGSVALTRQWFRFDAAGKQTLIRGATGATHRLTSADRGRTIKVLVTGRKPNYASKWVWSAGTRTVA